MKIATWNVNSLKVRLPHVIDWLNNHQPDILCLQETKLIDDHFPLHDINALGYHCLFNGQKTYNGVAILSKRVISATYGDLRVVCVYVPNGESVESAKYKYKLQWLTALKQWLQQELIRYEQLIVLGDFNIAPEDRDVYDPDAWRDKVLCSQPERDALNGLIGLGLKDGFRLFEQSEKSYTWWDYRMMAFRLNRGLRIDHILISDALTKDCSACSIDKQPRKLERPSDHAPVIVEFKAKG